MKAFNTTFLGIALAFGALSVYAQAPSSDTTDNTDQTQSGHWRKTTDPAPAQQSVQQTAQQQPADNGGDPAMSGPDDGQAPPQTTPSANDQAPPPQNGGWQNGPGQYPSPGQYGSGQSGQYGTTQSNGGWQNGPPPPQQQGGWSRFGDRPMPPPRQPLPPTITLPAGTWVTFRVNQPLSSDHNQKGDAFMGTLASPIVANGIVLAHPGQTVSGTVSEAQKAGRVSGTSRLGLELTQISLADGQQVNVHTQMVERRGPTSYGRDAAAIGTTTVAGAAIGAAVNGGVGAGVGAAAGLVASTVGVMLTRGRPTVVYPEQVLTFQLTGPVTLAADFNSEAFQPVSQQDYQQGSMRPYGPSGYGAGGYGPGYGAAPAPGYYGYGYGYPYAYGPYYGYGYYPWWGPGIGIGFYGGGFYGRGFYGGGFRGGGGFHGGGGHR